MLLSVQPKLPMRNKLITKEFYTTQLHFEPYGSADFAGYLMLKKDNIEIHFFEFPNLDTTTNYGQVYIRTNQIDALYQSLLNNQVPIHPAGHLQIKPWGQKEFSLLDPDNNLLTFGQSV
jgi:hypothetical protein